MRNPSLRSCRRCDGKRTLGAAALPDPGDGRACGAPARIRTRNLPGRNRLLYPVELRRRRRQAMRRRRAARVRRRRAHVWRGPPPLAYAAHPHGGCSSARLERQVVALEAGGSSPLSHPMDDGGHPLRRVAAVAHTASAVVDCTTRAPLAQWQSNGLLIRRFWVRIPGGVLEKHQQGPDLGPGLLRSRPRPSAVPCPGPASLSREDGARRPPARPEPCRSAGMASAARGPELRSGRSGLPPVGTGFRAP